MSRVEIIGLRRRPADAAEVEAWGLTKKGGERRGKEGFR